MIQKNCLQLGNLGLNWSHIAIYPGTKFQLIWTTSDFGTKFTQKSMSEKNSKKINIKLKTGLKQCMSVSDFSQYRELQFLGPTFCKKTL